MGKIEDAIFHGRQTSYLSTTISMTSIVAFESAAGVPEGMIVMVNSLGLGTRSFRNWVTSKLRVNWGPVAVPALPSGTLKKLNVPTSRADFALTSRCEPK